MPYLIPGIFTMGIPAGDVGTDSFSYQYVDLAVLYNDGTNRLDVGQQIDSIMSANARNPVWDLLVSVNHAVEAPLNEGRNDIFIDALLRAEITIDTVGPQVSRWWVPSDKGDYGVLFPTKGLGPGRMRFIDSKKCVFQWKPGDYDGLQVILNPGVTGSINVYPWLGIPPVQWNFEGQGWQYFGGLFEFNGDLPKLPD